MGCTRICLASAAGVTVSTAFFTTSPTSTGWMVRRIFPEMIRDTSRMSSTIRVSDEALRATVASACDWRSDGIIPDWSSRVYPRMALSGVRSSWDSVARNSSFNRFAVCASR